MNKSEELYLRRKADQMKAMLDSPTYQPEQKLIAFHAIGEDLLLLQLETDPDVTKTVKQLFETDEDIVKDMNECSKKIQSIMESNKELQDIQNHFKELNEERFDMIKNFYKSFRKLLEPAKEGKEEIQPEKPVESTPSKELIEDEERKEIDKKLAE